MKITVVVRTYKRFDFLKEALSSIQLQTYNNWEVIIFDDGGDLENLEIYKKFKELNPNNRILYLTSMTNRELFTDSWKMGFYLSKGEVLVRLDDDDLLSPDALEYISEVYSEHKDLDFSYGSCITFNTYGLEDIIQTKTPFEHPKTKDMWAAYTISNNWPWKDPWSWISNYYEEPQHYTSIIHASKANQLCSYHTYIIRVKSALKVIDKFEITSNFVDDLEVIGSLEYLGLTHISLKKILTYVRNHNYGRITDDGFIIKGGNIREEITKIRDKVDYLRPNVFKTSIYPYKIKDNFPKNEITQEDKSNFNDFKIKVGRVSKSFN